VSKASPYLETKVEGDRSMVRKGGRGNVPEPCPSANLYMAKPGLVEPNQSDLARFHAIMVPLGVRDALVYTV